MSRAAQLLRVTSVDLPVWESAGLKKLNNWPTFPQLIIGGELVGGLDILREMEGNGELQEVLVSVGAK